MDKPDTLNVAQAAALLFADTETVLLLARQAALPGAKIGKSWVFLREDVLAFLRQRIRLETDERRRRLDEPMVPLAELVPVPRKGRRRVVPELPGLVGTTLTSPAANGAPLALRGVSASRQQP